MRACPTLIATRHHSLVVDAAAAPRRLGDSAWSEEPAHDDHPAGRSSWAQTTPPASSTVDGVQFHPESFMTTEGPLILANLGLPCPDVATSSPERPGPPCYHPS